MRERARHRRLRADEMRTNWSGSLTERYLAIASENDNNDGE